MAQPRYTEVTVASPGPSVFSSENFQQKRDANTDFKRRARETGRALNKQRRLRAVTYFNYRNSPFCVTMFYVLIILFVFVALSLSVLISSNMVCGLGSVRHKIALRNETSPMNEHGIVLSGEYGLDDITLAASTTGARVSPVRFYNDQVPCMLVFNDTHRDSELTSVSFGTSSQLEATVLAITQKDRRNTEIPATFFNSGWYLSEHVAREYSDGTDAIGVLKDDAVWRVPAATMAASVYPVYYVNMSAFSVKRSARCASNYKIDIELGAFEKFELLLFRDFSGPVNFKNANFTGRLVIDGVTTLTVENTTLQHVLAVQDMDIQFGSGKLKIIIPGDDLEFYGIAGAKDADLYRTHITIPTRQLPLTLRFNNTFAFTLTAGVAEWSDVVTGDSITLETTKRLACADSNGQTSCTIE